MAGPVTAKTVLILNTFRRYRQEIKRLLLSQRSNSDETDDTDKVGGYDWIGLLKPARDQLAAHIARKDNPHQEDIESVGSYKASTVKSLLESKMVNGYLPISSYGVIDELTDAQITQAWTFSGFTFRCTRMINAVLAGSMIKVPASSAAISLPANPQNKTFYVYLRLNLGTITYQVREDSPPESEMIMLIGKIVTGATAITSMNFYQVMRIETFRLSKDPVGSAIPFVVGSYENPTKLDSRWQP